MEKHHQHWPKAEARARLKRLQLILIGRADEEIEDVERELREALGIQPEPEPEREEQSGRNRQEKSGRNRSR